MARPGPFARRLHRAIRRVLPAEVRARHERGIDETFAFMYEDAASRGPLAVARLFAGEAAGAVRARVTTVHWKFFMSSILALSARLRSLRRRPGFALGILLTLALATAALTTVFAVVDTVLLKALPYPDAGQLVTVYEAMPAKGQATSLIAPARIADWGRMSQSLSAIAGQYSENVTDTSVPEPERLQARRVTPGFFGVFGTAPIAGRVFTGDEERFSGPSAIVISDALARRRFGGAAAAVGQVLRVGGKATPIVGVMPATFAPASIDAWLPTQFSSSFLTVRAARFLTGVARMKPGVTIGQARADLAGVQSQLGATFPDTDKGWTVAVRPLVDSRVGASASGLPLVFGAIALLWLIGVTNVAGLMVVELQRRSRDLAVRTAIGGSRAHLVGELAGEAALLSLGGTAVGVGLAAVILPLVPSAWSTMPRANELGLDGRAIGFAAAAAVVSAVIFGLWPALAATRRRGVTLASLGTRSGAAPRHALQSGLVVLQVAMSLLLVGSAGLLARSYVNLANVDAGFETDGVVTFHVGARWDENRASVGQFQAALLDALERAPGVTAAGFTNFVPMEGASLRSHVRVAGLPGAESDGSYSVGTRMVARGYLSALGVKLAAGEPCRSMTADPQAPRQALVNRRFVDEFAGGESVVGRTLSVTQGVLASYTIAGVVNDIVEDTPQSTAVPYVYTCDPLGSWPDPSYVVRTADAPAFIAGIRGLVRSLDGGRAVFGLRQLSEVTDDFRQSPRVSAAMVAIFAASAVLVAAAGLYGLFARLVADRSREIGVRLALGAAPSAIMRAVWGQALRLILAGVLVGLVASAAAARLIAASLFHVSATDPVTLAAAIGLLTLAGAAAVAAPAARAARVDPVVAMRGE